MDQTPVRQPIITDTSGREFACFPAAVLVFIVNEEEEILLLSPPNREGEWEIVKGALEAEETILEAALRETREEVGPDVRVRPLGTVHALTIHYDENVPAMVSLFFLLAYEGGQVCPGDDMAGSRFRWWSLEELAEKEAQVRVPSEWWIIERALDLYRLWKNHGTELGQLFTGQGPGM
jgi:ADP-ribose pyrophosphatase YjhB (NUDIX family)